MERARNDIHAPDLPDEGIWIGEDPGRMEALVARGPVLVHFFDFSQLNSVRTLPYLTGWFDLYHRLGLTVIGIQAPRFEVSGDREAAARGIARLGIPYPVVLDPGMDLWKLYGCEGWPSLFLWGRGGRLRWFLFGEGEYEATEAAIRESLGPSAAADLPVPLGPLRETDREGIEVIAPTPEMLPGDGAAWTAESGGSEFEVQYEAGSAWVTASGTGRLLVEIDDGTRETVEIDGPGLYRLSNHDGHERHAMVVRLDGNPEIWSISFAPGGAAG
jgi:hypothetical protein